MWQILFNRRGVAKHKRCGVILIELLICTCLALMAGTIVLESTSILVKLNTAAKEHRDSAYALIAVVEEVSLIEKDVLLHGKVAWRAEIGPGSSGPHISSRIVRITGKQGRIPISLEWETWGVTRR